MISHASGMLVLAIAILWSVRLISSSMHTGRVPPLALVLSLAAWILIALALTLLATPAAVIVLALVLAFAVSRHRDAETRTLLWALGIAVERQIPLAKMADAMARNRSDELGWRTERLARHLQAGVPLDQAFKRSKLRLPLDARLGLQRGRSTDSLASGLKLVGRSRSDAADATPMLAERFLYFNIVLLLMTISAAFIGQRITPTYGQLLTDFNLTFPPLSAHVFSVLQNVQILWILVGINLLLFFLLLLAWTDRYRLLRLPRWAYLAPPIARADRAVLLRFLASAVRQNEPLSAALASLAPGHPRRAARRCLERASQDIEAGVDWAVALRRIRVISVAQVAVLRSAQRAGNLAWALEHLADASVRRLEHRAAAASRILLPVLVVLLALPIGILAIAVLLPLAELTQVLSGYSP